MSTYKLPPTPFPIPQHGIFEDKSDYVVHVGVIAKAFFLFTPQAAIEAIIRLNPQTYVPAGKDRALGFCIPITEIKGLIVIPWPSYAGWKDFREDMTTTEKGDHAHIAVLAALDAGIIDLPGVEFPPAIQDVMNDKQAQYNGLDLRVAHLGVGIKHDRRAGPTGIYGCSGNLYIQTHERNPDRQI